MAIHESSVNHKNLIEDLAQMYSDDVSEVIVSELLANSLDSGADCIEVNINSHEKTLVISDNGKGMTRSQFGKYHDFAAGLKRKGNTIGFAGVGAKISFNIANRVKTETRSKSFYGGSDWYFDSDGKLVWEDIQPKGIPSGKTGTRVEVYFSSELKFPYSSEKELIDLIRRHYLPILDERFLALYEDLGLYSKTTKFVINGKELLPTRIERKYSLGRTKDIYPTKKNGDEVGFGFFGLANDDYPISERRCGISLCTYGKVVKSEFLNQYPGLYAPKILGVVELPGLIKFLNTSKSDFIRSRGKGRSLESLLDLVRQDFKKWLVEIGVSEVDKNDNAIEAAKIEREIKKIISDIPELAEFFGSSNSRMGKSLVQNNEGEVESHLELGMDITYPTGTGDENGGQTGPVIPGEEDGESLAEGGEERAKPISRKVRTGPRIAFSSRPSQSELAWIEGNSIIINSGHPSYEKAKSNPTSRTLHNLFSIGSAIQKIILSDENRKPDLMFVDKMMAAWGRNK